MNEFIPYGRQDINDDDVVAVVAALRSDFLTTGPAVEQFESDLEAVVGAPCLAVNSGTAALHAAYAACGLGPGTQLITTPLTFAATATAALHLGAEVVFADVDDETLCLDPQAAAAAVTSKTRVIAPVDYAGQPADMPALRSIADAAGAHLVEDAAHAIGSKLHGRPVGSMADLTTFSFHPVKTITTAEGGAIAVADADLREAASRFRNHGLVRDPSLMRSPGKGAWHQEVHAAGLNYRMPDVLAALGSSQLRRLPGFVAARERHTSRYRALLADVPGLRMLEVREGAEPAWHLFPVRILGGRRREVFDHLRAAGIGVQVHYLPVHLHPAFEDLGYRAGMCPIAESACEELISLPLFPGLAVDQQDRVVDVLRSALR